MLENFRYLNYIAGNLPAFLDIADDLPGVVNAPLYNPKAVALAAVIVKVGEVLEKSPLPRTFAAADAATYGAMERDAEAQLGGKWLRLLMLLLPLFFLGEEPVTE